MKPSLVVMILVLVRLMCPSSSTSVCLNTDSDSELVSELGVMLISDLCKHSAVSGKWGKLLGVSLSQRSRSLSV